MQITFFCRDSPLWEERSEHAAWEKNDIWRWYAACCYGALLEENIHIKSHLLTMLCQLTITCLSDKNLKINLSSWRQQRCQRNFHGYSLSLHDCLFFVFYNFFFQMLFFRIRKENQDFLLFKTRAASGFSPLGLGKLCHLVNKILPQRQKRSTEWVRLLLDV